MKPGIISILVCALGALVTPSACEAGAPKSTAPVPTKLHISIGTCFRPAFQVDLADSKLCWKRFLYSEVEKRRIMLDSIATCPTLLQWREFRRTLDALNVWRWSEHYEVLMCDGSGWSLEADYSDRRIKSGGSNGYPDEKGNLAKDGDETPVFLRFVSAAERLPGAKQIGFSWEGTGILSVDQMMMYACPKIEMRDATCSDSLDFLEYKGEQMLQMLPKQMKAHVTFERRFDEKKKRGLVNYEIKNVTFNTVFRDILGQLGLTYATFPPDRVVIIDANPEDNK